MRLLADRGLVYGSVGNGSVREEQQIWITPTHVRYETMQTADVVGVDLDGQPFAAHRREPSRELPFHLAIYQARPDVQAILHTHSPHASAWSFLDRELTPETEDVLYHDVGPIRTTPYEPAGSPRLATAAVAALGASRAVLLARHGVVAAARSLPEAIGIAQAVEHQAHVALLLSARL
jgi:L-fuculose-phosphate aldolase